MKWSRPVRCRERGCDNYATYSISLIFSRHPYTYRCDEHVPEDAWRIEDDAREQEGGR